MKTIKCKCLVIKHFINTNAAHRRADNTSGVTSGVGLLTVACKSSIRDLCDFYGLDSTIVAREQSSVSPSSVWTDTRNPTLSDMNPATDEKFDDRAEEEEDDDDDDDDGENSDKSSPVYRNMAMRDFEKWTDYSFVKP